MRLGRREEALAVVNSLPRQSPIEKRSHAVRGACLAAVGNVLAGKTYLETAYKAGCREPLCFTR